MYVSNYETAERRRNDANVADVKLYCDFFVAGDMNGVLDFVADDFLNRPSGIREFCAFGQRTRVRNRV